MASTPNPSLPPVISEPTPSVTPTPTPASQIPIVRDYPLTNTVLPNPTALATTSAKRISNQINLTAARAGDPEPYIFGRVLADPKIIAADDSGQFLVLDMLWAGHECDAIEYLVYSNVNEGLGTQLGHNQHFTGAAGQAASSIMAAAKGGSYDTLAGKTHSVISWRAAFGLDVRAMIRGAKLYDPRTSPATTTYSANPALCLARILVDSGYTMDWDSVATAADYCDELVGSPQQKRWEVGIQINTLQELRAWVETFAVYCNCFVDRIGSTVSLIPDTPRSPNHTVTADDMLEGSIKTGTPGLKNVPEHVAVNYQPIIEEGAPGYAVYNEIRSATTDTAAVPGSITTLNAPGIQEYSRAKRLAVMTYNKAHNAKSLEFIGFDDSIVRSIGDVGTITNAAYGLSSETMTLVYNQQVAPGRWLRKYEAYNANNYSDDLYSEPSVNHTTISGPNNPPTGPTPTLAEELFTDAAGVTYSRIKVNWLGYSWAYIDGYRIVVYSGETTLLDTEVDHEGLGIYTQYANPLVSGLTYTVDIYLRSNTGAYGSTPGTANITSTQGNNAFLDVGDVTNMHVYTLDGDGKYATTSQKSGSPLKGETFASRFGSSPQGAWASGETWLGNQICETTFETEVMDTGQTWSGGWKFIDVNTTTLGGATKANFVTLSGEYSPLVWVDHAGNLYSGEARYMKAKSTVSDSPLSAGYGLHVKLPIPATFLLGN